MSFKPGETVNSLKHLGRTGKIEGYVPNSSMLHVKWGSGTGLEWITQEFPKDIARVKSGPSTVHNVDNPNLAFKLDKHNTCSVLQRGGQKSTVLEPGDKVCFKSAPDSVAIVRDERYHEGVVLLDWPNGTIGSANINDLLLVQGEVV